MPYDSICTAPSAIDNSVGTLTYPSLPYTSSTTADTDTYTYTSSYEPYTSTSTTGTMYTLTMGPTSEEIEKKIKDASDKIDQHVDALEQDIDFLNKRQEDQENNIDNLAEENLDLKVQIRCLRSAIDTLKEQITELNNKYNNMYTDMLFCNDRITHVEDKIYEMDKRNVGQDK